MSRFDQLIEKLELGIARGINRKTLKQVPDSVRTKPFKVGYSPRTKTTKPSVQTAKATPTVLRQVPYAQVVDMAHKYEFDIPTQQDSQKHLGSTGIRVIYKNGKYFLVKRS